MPALNVDHSGHTGGAASVIYVAGDPGVRYFYGTINSDTLPAQNFTNITALTYLMSQGNDALSVSGSAIADGCSLYLDANGGTDSLSGDFSAVNTNFTLVNGSLTTANVTALDFETYDLWTGNGADSITLSNIGGSYFRTGAGDDIFTFTNPTGYLYAAGGAGKDTLNVNAATHTTGQSSTIYSNGGVEFYGDFYHDNGRVEYNSMEKLNWTMGSGNDILSMDGTPLAQSNTNIAVNGGGGVNSLGANLGVVTSNIVLNGASLTTSRLSLKNFSIYNVTLGSGNDTVTLNTPGGGQYLRLGAGNDSVSLTNALGYQYAEMGAGQDSVSVDNSVQTVGVSVTVYNDGGVRFYGDVYNDSTSRTEYNGAENLTFKLGTGADSVSVDGGALALLTNTLSIDAGAGGNYLSANLGVITTDLVLNQTSLTTDRVSLLGFVAYNLTFGSGNDTVTLTETAGQTLRMGDGNDSVTINGAHAYQYVELAAGFDSLAIDNSTQTVGATVTVYNDSGVRFYGDVYNDSGSRTEYNGAEVLLFRLGAGNDSLSFDGAALASLTHSADIDAGGGSDTLSYAGLTVLTTDITVLNDAFSTDRLTLDGFEVYGDIRMGSGNDSVTVAGANNQGWRMGLGNDSVTLTAPTGYQYVEAGGGTDSLDIDNSLVTANLNHAVYNDSGVRFYGDFYNQTNRTEYNGMEHLSVILGSGNDGLSLDAAPLVQSNTSIDIDGGAGTDGLNANLSALTTNVVLNETSLTSTRLSVTNFEGFYVTFGSGNDTVTRTTAAGEQFRLAAGDDSLTFNSALGYQYVEGGAGFDFLTVRNTSQEVGVTSYIYNDSGVRFYGNFYNDGNRTEFNGFERIAYTMGRSNDVLNVDGNGLGGAGNRLNLSGGTGIDHLNLNLSGLSGLNLVWSGVTLTIGVNTFASFETISVQLSGSSQYVILSSGNDSASGAGGNDTIDGGAGNDTLNGDSGFDVVSYASAPGPVTVSLALQGAAQATGNGDDLLSNFEGILGSAYNDSLTGDANANRLDGNTGNDTLSGDLGNDTYVVSTATDVIVEATGEGTDTVESNLASYTLGANLENLTLTGTGIISGTGNALNNVLTGNSANNVLSGGLGDDTYIVQNSGDNVVEAAGQGTDVILSSASYDLAGRIVETLTLTGTADINATGNGNANTLNGNSGANRLDGGAGNDTLTGGLSNDTYVINTGGDVIIESAGEGSDTVESSITYTLGATLENLTLTGSGNISGTGNALNNILTANLGNSTLAGGLGDDTYYVDNAGDSVVELGGEGNDTIYSSDNRGLFGTYVETLILTGAANIVATGNSFANRLVGNSGTNTLTGLGGDDTYVVQNAGDTTVEAAGEGTDLVESAITWTLATNVENLLLTGGAAVNGTGNSGNNVLTGNEANNVLSGLGGDDTYYIQNSGDNVVEANGNGTDTVVSTVTYSLAGRYVEFLTLVGAANIDATGNGNANTLTGNGGNNVLTGLGGHDVLDGSAGADTLIGGTGNDSYVVDDAGDVVTEAAVEGIDLVMTALTYTLAANVENLSLTGTAAINGTGNGLNNVLTGNSGVNVLTGGLGNDTYYVQSAGDNVVEANGEGTDIIYSTASYSLSGRYAEAIVLTGSANVNATGNSLANSLTGNDGNNTINGKGGTDILTGGLGSDLFLFETSSGTDTVTDFSAAQNDTININAYTGGVANAGLVTQSGANVLITLGGGNVITVNSATTADVLAHIVW